MVDDLLTPGRVTGAQVPQLQAAMTAFATSQVLSDQQVLVSTAIPATLAVVQSSWRSVAVPVALITVQLLVLCLLLLFLAVTDAVEARGPEIALAKLRGRGAWATIAFGFPSRWCCWPWRCQPGPWPGGGLRRRSSHVLLRPGTAVVLPGLAWATAAAATAGGLAAAVGGRPPDVAPAGAGGVAPLRAAGDGPRLGGGWRPRGRCGRGAARSGRQRPDQLRPGRARSPCWYPDCSGWRLR